MGIKERKKRDKEERCALILDTAGKIIAAEGIENLSIRKIANEIEYSPSVIYHYFRDKEDIVNQLMQKGYKKITDALAAAQLSGGSPGQRLREMIKRYIETALQMPDEFMSVQLNSSPPVLEHTASLFKGAVGKKPALAFLYQCLKDIYKDKETDDGSLELTAQVIAVSTLGLIIRLTVEKDLAVEQRAGLIDHYIKCIVDGMILGEPVNNF